jgi:glycosidase
MLAEYRTLVMKPIFARVVLLIALMQLHAAGEAMLQYFNTPWKEIEGKMPELAEAGYESIWLPPPTKASGGLSVGYDLWDRFDLGSKDQRGTVGTRYGTEAELLSMMRAAHRFGIRIYFDNIMNHNAFDIPGFNESTPIDVYPGFVPEDFHLRVTEEGFYRKWDNTRSWGDAWQVMHLGLSDLIDIAQEPGEWNNNFGRNEGDRIKKISFIRHPQNPDYYCYKPTAPGQKHSGDEGQYVGFGGGNGLTQEFLAANADFYSEYVEDMLHRSVRWKMDRTRADGLRLDAVKHVRDDFFGASGPGKDSSNYGYTGKAQVQFNLSRGFSDWDNHRNSVFNTEVIRDDAMMFGEHLGQSRVGKRCHAGAKLS